MAITKWDVVTKEAISIAAAYQEAATNEDVILKILDVGGAMKPLVFATHVIDFLPYVNRAWYGRHPEEAGAGAERFSQETWRQWDLCVTPWPYADKEFDIVWCTQTIEDLRDPIGVLKEISRVGKQGYLTTIHRNFESLFDVNGSDFAGYVHHFWLVEPDHDMLKFTRKYPLLHVSDKRYTPNPTGDREINCWWTNEIEGWECIHSTLQEIEDDLKNYAISTGRVY